MLSYTTTVFILLTFRCLCYASLVLSNDIRRPYPSTFLVSSQDTYNSEAATSRRASILKVTLSACFSSP